MSLPTTVVYVTLAVLVGPGLTQLGIHPLAAHLFLFYFGMLSLITPPDCLATYAAAAIARADFWKTGWTGMRLGIVAYVVPFAFVFQPALLGKAPAVDVVVAVLAAAAGVIVLAVGCVGYLVRPLSWARRSRPRRDGAPRPRLCRWPGARPRARRPRRRPRCSSCGSGPPARPSRRTYVQPGPERPATREIR